MLSKAPVERRRARAGMMVVDIVGRRMYLRRAVDDEVLDLAELLSVRPGIPWAIG